MDHSDPQAIDRKLRLLLTDVLALPPARAAALQDATPMFGAMPELDSMALAGLLTEIEDRFAIIIEDDEVGGDLFESFGALRRYVAGKVRG